MRSCLLEQKRQSSFYIVRRAAKYCSFCHLASVKYRIDGFCVEIEFLSDSFIEWFDLDNTKSYVRIRAFDSGEFLVVGGEFGEGPLEFEIVLIEDRDCFFCKGIFFHLLMVDCL